ncbi:MAG: glycerophosphodiester phosphodiesterase family protein [Cytophagales bacterium]|nr:glycerophosphodiester phosphodiesterase family protein [Cytophagales bacterium]
MKTVLLTNIILFSSFLICMSQQKHTTHVIAHRGAWKNTGVPENSIAALQHAVKLNCYGSEFDVHLSADSVPFILHNHSIQGVHIEKTNAVDLKRIKLANGESLPTLEEYLLAEKGQTKTRLILEIKSSSISKERSLALTKKCVELVTQTGVTAITDYIAFDFDVCLQVKKLNPKAHVQYLSGDKTPEDLATAGLDGFDYHFSVLKKNESWLAEAHKRRLSTNAWTVNDEETMQWLMDQKIDMITTNEPEKLLKLIK